jgi:hypothetical protein
MEPNEQGWFKWIQGEIIGHNSLMGTFDCILTYKINGLFNDPIVVVTP